MIIQKQNSSKNFSGLGRTLQFIARYLAPKFHTLDPINLNNLFPQEKDVLQQQVFNKIDIKAKEMLPASSTTSPQNTDELGGFLSLMQKVRQENKISFPKKNQTRITGSDTTPGAPKVSEVTEVFDDQSFYNQYGPHTQVTRLQNNNWKSWVDFVVTQDNEIILSPRSASIGALLGKDFESLGRYVDPYLLSSGTLIKTAGKIRVEQHNRAIRIILAAESDFWSVDRDEMLGMVRDVFKQNGCSSTDNLFFLNKKDGISLKIEHCVPDKFLVSVNDYLNTTQFPVQSESESAYSIEQVVIEKLKGLFFAIDDAVLSSRNVETIKELFDSPYLWNGKQENCRLSALKESIGDFFWLTINTENFLNTEADSPEMQQVNDSLQGILTLLKEIQEQYKINVDFIFGEILLLYSCCERIKRQENQNSQEKKLNLENFGENVCQSSRRSAVVALNWRDPQIKRFLQFYDKNPVQTCIHLLRDYTKNSSRFKRFITGAWNRHYASQVENFLDKYDRGSLSDGGSIKAILDHLFSEGLPESFVSGTCAARIDFCAILNGEPQAQPRNRAQLESEAIAQAGNESSRSRVSQIPVASVLSKEPLSPPQKRKVSQSQPTPEDKTKSTLASNAVESSVSSLSPAIPLSYPSSQEPAVKDISNDDSSAVTLPASTDQELPVKDSNNPDSSTTTLPASTDPEKEVLVEQKSKSAESEEEVVKDKIENQEPILPPPATAASATLVGGAGLFVTSPKKEPSVKDSKPQSEDLMSSFAEADVGATASFRK